jgi:hypothetical protein
VKKMVTIVLLSGIIVLAVGAKQCPGRKSVTAAVDSVVSEYMPRLPNAAR